MTAFQPGDHVVHVRHGSGTVIESRIIEQENTAREYFVIELNNERGLLMIPMENVNEADLRHALQGLEIIEKVLADEPETLADDHRARQNKIKTMLKTRNPSELATVVRDLTWREQTAGLTYTDSQLKESAQRLLAQELALHPNYEFETARAAIAELVERVVRRYEG